MQNKAGTASPKKAGVSIAGTTAAAALREQLASLGIKEEKVAPAFRVRFDNNNTIRILELSLQAAGTDE